MLAAPSVVASLNGPLASAAVTVATPVHLSEPSGQYASGHVCTGNVLPSAVASENPCAFVTLPRGHRYPEAHAGGPGRRRFEPMHRYLRRARDRTETRQREPDEIRSGTKHDAAKQSAAKT